MVLPKLCHNDIRQHIKYCKRHVHHNHVECDIQMTDVSSILTITRDLLKHAIELSSSNAPMKIYIYILKTMLHCYKPSSVSGPNTRHCNTVIVSNNSIVAFAIIEHELMQKNHDKFFVLQLRLILTHTTTHSWRPHASHTTIM